MKLQNLLLALLLASSTALVACNKDDGPMEEMGAKMDKAVDETKDAAEDVADDVEDAAEDVKDAVEGDG